MHADTTSKQTSSKLMWIHLARLGLGIIFLGASVNGLAGLVPFSYEGVAASFMNSLVESGFLTVVKMLELIAALLLLMNRYVPLALTILAPIIVNILLFHVFMSPDALLGLAVLNVVLLLQLLWVYRKAFAALLRYQPS